MTQHHDLPVPPIHPMAESNTLLNVKTRLRAMPSMALAISTLLAGAATVRSQSPVFLDIPQRAHLPATDDQDGTAIATLDADGDGHPDLVVGSSQEPVAIWRNLGDGNFEPLAQLPPFTRHALELHVGDFDGDGDDDLITVIQSTLTSPPTPSLSYFHNVGGGTFVDVTAALFGGPVQVAPVPLGDRIRVGDIDDDTDLDLVFADQRVYLNDGAGQFTVDTSLIPAPADNIRLLFDADDDTDLDLVDVSFPGTVFLNDGTGNFGIVPSIPLPQHAALFPDFAQPTDLDQDGDLDLILEQSAPNRPPTIWINDGSGTFADETAARMPSPLSNPGFVFEGGFAWDADNDGDFDIAVRGRQDNTAFYQNSGTGTFTLNNNYAQLSDLLPQRPSVLFDADGDSRLDAAILTRAGSDGALLLQVEDGVYLDTTIGRLPSSALGARVRNADFDNDGDQDVITGEAYFENDGTGAFRNRRSPIPFSSPNGQMRSFEICDIGQDGSPDALVVRGSGAGSNLEFVEVTPSSGGGPTFVPIGTTFILYEPDAVACGDLNGDGEVDVVVAQRGLITGFVILSSQPGMWSQPTALPTALRTQDVDLGDLDGDSDLDILISGRSGGTQVLINDSAGNFSVLGSASAVLDIPFARMESILFDIDNDNDLDIVANVDQESRAFLNDGLANFVDASDIWFPGAPFFWSAPAIGDVDNDGDLDFLASADVMGRPALFLNQRAQGRNEFLNGGPAFFGPNRVRAVDARLVDLDGDGATDVVWTGMGTRVSFNNVRPHLNAPYAARVGRAFSLQVPLSSLAPAFGFALFSTTRLATAIPTPFGNFALEPAETVVINMTADVSALSLELEVPADQALVGFPFHWQALSGTLTTPSSLRFTNPISSTITF